ncbi:MAG: DUF1801 domain-containing protein [Bacteroidota bacterium]
MTEVENLIYQFDNPQKEIMLFFHKMLIEEHSLTDKITFKNPCYYGKSWICYLKALKNNQVELAFMRGNELSNNQRILKHKNRKQLRSLNISNLKLIPLNAIKQIIHEAILLDETNPYESKRKRK